MHVVDTAGTPVAGARVVLVAGERDLVRSCTDDQGSAHLELVPEAIACRAHAVGFLPHTVAVAAMATTRIELPRAPCVHGRVFAADGQPQAGVEFALLPTVAGRRGPPPRLPLDTHTVHSDARGHFRLPWPSTTPHDLIACSRGHAPLVVPALRPPNDAPLLLTLVAGATLVGVACDGTERTPHAVVEVWTAAEEPGGTTFGPAVPWRGGQLLAHTRCDATGAFRFPDVPEGRAWLTFGAATPWHGQVAVDLARAQTTQVELRASAQASVSGVVQGADRDAQVFVFGGTLPVQTRAIALDGTFAAIEVPPGRYLVGVATPPIAPLLHAAVQQWSLDGRTDLAQPITLQAGERRALRLAAGNVAEGRVAGVAFVAGRPALDHCVVLDSVPAAGARRRTCVVRADGSFESPALPGGLWLVSLQAAPGSADLASTTCRVHAGATSRAMLSAP
ncbi:MAG: carboxypeptidase regulatory-like domain-containing protein [Planctomycetes bacterium]|nr:carboxypeptidase regulatory-like domain-containing protein [Planctomycetota bacterium]